jgi:hypothetical protein
VVAIVGLVLCAISATYDIQRSRRERKLPAGEELPPSWWTGRRVAIIGVGTVALLALVVFGVIELFPSSGGNANVTATSVTTTAPPTTSGRPPAQVRVLVLNASGVAKAATAKAGALAAAGYPIVGTGNAPLRRGTVVECKPGFDVEAAALARAVGLGTTVQPFPTPAPVGSATASCVVVLGR